MRTWIASRIIPTVLILAMGCADKLSMTASQDVEVAQGELKLQRTEDGNTRVDLKIKQLTPAERVQPGAITYVVWAQPLAVPGAAENLGMLQLSEGHRGELRTITGLREFAVYVTAEPTPLADRPTGKRLLWATVMQTAYR